MDTKEDSKGVIVVHFTPHPLVTMSDAEIKIWLADFNKQPESLLDYVKHSSNPRWAASHLIRAIASGLQAADVQACDTLLQVAERLSLSHG